MYPTFEKIREMAAGDYKKNSNLQRVIRRQLHTSRDDADSAKGESSLLSAGKRQPERSVGQVLLFWDMTLPWKSPVQTESCEFEKTSKTETFGRSGNATESSTESSTEEFDRLPIQGDAIRRNHQSVQKSGYGRYAHIYRRSGRLLLLQTTSNTVNQAGTKR